ncbi:hemophore-related protein [Mycobacterium lehmannii]|uniref:hemophore-related protein n=1 Tax=Mycobacterium lehmannii TaxID=2048550 RepID=UPI000B942385|nr:hemophore-related protein [Mycobacterium lehmannii]
MAHSFLIKLAVGAGGALALALSAGAGSATADPDYGPMINTTCTYEQAIASVHAENPMAAEYLDASPPNLQFLQMYMAASPDERVDLLNRIKNNPGIDQALPVFQQMMTNCVNY